MPIRIERLAAGGVAAVAIALAACTPARIAETGRTVPMPGSRPGVHASDSPAFALAGTPAAAPAIRPSVAVRSDAQSGDTGYIQESWTEPGSFHKNIGAYFGRFVSAASLLLNIDIAPCPDPEPGPPRRALRLAAAPGESPVVRCVVLDGYEGSVCHDEFELYMDQNKYPSNHRFLQFICDTPDGPASVRFELLGQPGDPTRPRLAIRLNDANFYSTPSLQPSDFPVRAWNRVRTTYVPAENPGGAPTGSVSLARWNGSEWVTLLSVSHSFGKVTNVHHLAAAVAEGETHQNYRRRWVRVVDGLERHGLALTDPTWWRDYLHQLRSWWPEPDGRVSIRVWTNYNAGLYGFDANDQPVWGVQIAQDPAFQHIVADTFASNPKTISAAEQYCAAVTVPGLDPNHTYFIRGVIRTHASGEPIPGFEARFRTPSTFASEPMTDFTIISGTCVNRAPMGGLEKVRELIESGQPVDVVAVLDDAWYTDSDLIFDRDAVTPEQWGYYWSAALNCSTIQRIAASAFLVVAVGDHDAMPFSEVDWQFGGSWVGIIVDEAGDIMQGDSVNAIDWMLDHTQPWIESGYPDQSPGGPRETADSVFPDRTRADGVTPIEDRAVRFWKTATREIDLALVDPRSWCDYDLGAEGNDGEMPRLGAEQLAWYTGFLGDPDRNLKCTLMGMMLAPRYLAARMLTGSVQGQFQPGELVIQDVSFAQGTFLAADADRVVIGKENGNIRADRLLWGASSGATIMPVTMDNSSKGGSDNWSRIKGLDYRYSHFLTRPRVYQNEIDAIIAAPHPDARSTVFSGDDHLMLLTSQLAPGDPRWLPEMHSAYASPAQGLPSTHTDSMPLIADLAHDPALVDYASNLGGHAVTSGYGSLVVDESTGRLTYAFVEFDEANRRTTTTTIEGYSFEPVRSEPCPADFNRDGIGDFFDVQDFLDAFSREDPRADLTGDGAFGFFDIAEFLDLFAAGCP